MESTNYIVYETRNLVNNMIYIGVHKQKGLLFDGYLGSGKYFRRSLEFHGVHKFKRKILSVHTLAEKAYSEEAFIVNEEFLKRKDVYNLKVGGTGGWMKSKEIIEKQKSTRKRNGSDRCLQFFTPKSILKSKFTRVFKFGSLEGNMTNKSSRDKATLTRKKNGTDQMKQCHTPNAIKKSLTTKILKNEKWYSHLHTKEVREKAKSTFKETISNHPHYEAKHLHTKEVIDKRIKTLISNSLIKYPILKTEVIVLGLDGNEFYRGNLYDLSVLLFSRNEAVKLKRYVIKAHDIGYIPYVKRISNYHYYRVIKVT